MATRAPSRNVRITKPKLKGDAVEPVYPKELQIQGIEGDVVVVVFIGIDGLVQKAKIVKPSPYPEFNDSALAAAKARQFFPATRGGEPIATSLKFTIRFRLKDE
ncbi:MAG: hypothetical protein DRQ56_02805 [Gammaproteobacteria bacterium]|nr:MAG: hypothetical protein DRQ56_02805 [Gammaproteobacteria bacterium]